MRRSTLKKMVLRRIFKPFKGSFFIFLMFCIAFSGIVSAFDWDSFTVYYSSDEGSGNIIKDNATGLFNLTDNNSNVVGGDGILGNGLNFNGIDGLSTMTKDFKVIETLSFSFWTNSSKSNEGILFAKRGGNQSYQVEYFQDKMVFTLWLPSGQQQCLSPAGYNTNNASSWTHTVLTYNGSYMAIWKNGVLNTTCGKTGSINNNIRETTVGFTSGGKYYFGHLDEFGLSNTTVFVQDNISFLYNGGLGRVYRRLTTSINSPTSPTLSNTNLNITSSTGQGNLVNVTLYIDGVLNETLSISGTTNNSLFIGKFNSTGTYNISFITCNDVVVCRTSSNTTIEVRPFEEVATYSPTTTSEGLIETFTVQLNTVTGATVTSANLIYDIDNVYSTSISEIGGGVYNVSATILIPDVTSSTTKSFYFNLTLTGAISYNTTNTTLTVNEVDADDCSSFTNVLYNFTVYDEKTLAKLIGTTNFVNGSVIVEIYDNSHTSLIDNFSVAGTNSNPFAICLQDTLATQADYKIDTQVQYWAKGYVKEFYNIINDDLTPSDLNTNISLYLLDNDTSQPFKIVYRDSSYVPVENAIIQIQRKYIGENLFRTVEQPKTDAKGETLAHLELNDAIYTFVILVDNEIDATFNNIIAVCQNPALDDCQIDLTNVQSFVSTLDFTTINGFSFTGPTYNSTSRGISTIFSVNSGTVGLIELNVTHFDNLGTTQVCADSLISSSGTLSCTVPNSFGNSTVVVTLYQDGEKKAQAILNLAQDPSDIYGANLVITALLIFLALLGIGINGNPIVASTFLVITLVVLIGLNIFYSPSFIGAGATILFFIIAIIIILIKGGNRG